MKIITSIIITILILSALTCAVSAQQSQTYDELLKKIESQEQEIKKLKTETINQRKQIVELKSEIFSFKYDSQNQTEDLPSLATKMQELTDEITNLQTEIKRLNALCKKANIDPNSDLDNIRRVQNNLPRPNKITVGQLFPRLRFKNLNGTLVDIDKLQGKVVLIDFWATWCKPCTQEMPNVIALYNKYHNKGFEIIGISLDSDLVKLKTYLTYNQITWPQYYDGKGWNNAISSRFGVRSIPTTVLIDKNGIVRKLNLHGANLENAVHALCQTAPD
jgi:thiol-disulfide isomerase/thioredoxin